MLQTIMDLLMVKPHSSIGYNGVQIHENIDNLNRVTNHFPLKEIEYLYKMEEESRKDAIVG